MTTVADPLLDAAEIAALLSGGRRYRGAPLAHRLATHGRLGATPSNRRGAGLEYVESRRYQPGDDPRHFNWRATARSGRAQVRVFEEELSPDAWFVLDRRAAMRFGTRVRTKAAQAGRLALWLAAFEAQRGAAIATVILESRTHWLAPVHGSAGVARLVRWASAPAAPQDTDDGGPLATVLGRLAARAAAGSRIYLLSDGRDLAAGDAPVLARLGARHAVSSWIVEDAVEQHLPDIGRLELAWSAHRAQVDTRRQGLLSGEEARREALLKMCRRAGWRVRGVRADEADVGAICARPAGD